MKLKSAIPWQPKLRVNEIPGAFFLLLNAGSSHLLHSRVLSRNTDLLTSPPQSNWELGLKLLNWISAKPYIGEQLK